MTGDHQRRDVALRWSTRLVSIREPVAGEVQPAAQPVDAPSLPTTRKACSTPRRLGADLVGCLRPLARRLQPTPFPSRRGHRFVPYKLHLLLRHIKTSLNPGLSVDCMSRARAMVATLARSAVLLAVPEAGLAELRGKKATGALIKLTGAPPHDT